MTVVSEISEVREKVAALPPEIPWRESVLEQLRYCEAVIQGDQPPERLEKFTMGLIAARELEGELWADALSSIQFQLQQSYLSFAARVRLGIHLRA